MFYIFLIAAFVVLVLCLYRAYIRKKKALHREPERRIWQHSGRRHKRRRRPKGQTGRKHPKRR